MMTKMLPRVRSFVLLAAVIGVTLLTACLPAATNEVSVSLGQVIALSKSGNISKSVVDTGLKTITVTAVVNGPALEITDLTGTATKVTTGTLLVADIDSLNMADLQALGVVFPSDSSTVSTSGGTLGNILLFVLPVLLFVGLMYILFRAGRGAQSQATAFAKSRASMASPDRPKVTFADVADAEEAKEDLREVVEFLKNRTKFQAIGATVPKGVLLVGPPGTGKTLLARAVAGEAGVPFFSVSGSEFVEMFVGVGAARVRDLFKQAKTNAPSIIFIDEIDAVGRQRAGAVPGSHEEREQTLNQILVEMDGFDANIGVIVLAATNRVDVLDPALLRPGRFDRRATLDRPDTNGRLAILKIHSKGKKLDPSIDLNVIAKETHGFSGADLANLMNEAAIMAVRRSKQSVGMNELEEAIDRVLAGPERRSLRVNPRDRETTAYHESGHALVAHMLPNVDPVHKISIIARGTMGGYTHLLTEDRYFMTASQFKDTLAVLLAGHAAEKMIFGEASTGPHSDISQATDIARKMIMEYGMSEKLGLRTFGHESQGYLGLGGVEERDYGDEVAREIDSEIHDMIEEANKVATGVLEKNKPRLVHLAEKLLAVETLEGPELEAVFSEPITASGASVTEPRVEGNGQKPPPAPQQAGA